MIDVADPDEIVRRYLRRSMERLTWAIEMAINHRRPSGSAKHATIHVVAHALVQRIPGCSTCAADLPDKSRF
jgi:hypothetical protein